MSLANCARIRCWSYIEKSATTDEHQTRPQPCKTHLLQPVILTLPRADNRCTRFVLSLNGSRIANALIFNCVDETFISFLLSVASAIIYLADSDRDYPNRACRRFTVLYIETP